MILSALPDKSGFSLVLCCFNIFCFFFLRKISYSPKLTVYSLAMLMFVFRWAASWMKEISTRMPPYKQPIVNSLSCECCETLCRTQIAGSKSIVPIATLDKVTPQLFAATIIILSLENYAGEQREENWQLAFHQTLSVWHKQAPERMAVWRFFLFDAISLPSLFVLISREKRNSVYVRAAEKQNTTR